jgi:O-methyltransferase
MQDEPERPDGAREGAVRFAREGYAAWQDTRQPEARGPGAEPEELRSAYLDLLKLSLCDLAGTSTTSVWRDPHTAEVMSRVLRGDDFAIRALGADWPLQGLTMVGLNRLDDLQSCVESIVRDGVQGDLIEAGSWRGGASILMRATLDALGAHDRTVWVADSFEGFPIPDDQHPETEPFAEVSFLAVPLEDVRGHFARLGLDRGVEFVPGFFQETMPTLTGRSWSLLRLDGDSYEATWVTLESLYPGLAAGGYVVVDDYGAVEECQRAVDDYRRHEGIDDPIEAIDWTASRWRKTSEARAGELPADGPPPARSNPKRAARGEPPRVRSVEEIDAVRRLREELDDLRGRLTAAEADARLLRSSPLRGPRAWLGARLRALRER